MEKHEDGETRIKTEDEEGKTERWWWGGCKQNNEKIKKRGREGGKLKNKDQNKI